MKSVLYVTVAISVFASIVHAQLWEVTVCETVDTLRCPCVIGEPLRNVPIRLMLDLGNFGPDERDSLFGTFVGHWDSNGIEFCSSISVFQGRPYYLLLQTELCCWVSGVFAVGQRDSLELSGWRCRNRDCYDPGIPIPHELLLRFDRCFQGLGCPCENPLSFPDRTQVVLWSDADGNGPSSSDTLITSFEFSAGSGQSAWDGIWRPLPGLILPADQYYVSINTGVCCWTTRSFWNSLDTISISPIEWECNALDCIGPPRVVPPPQNVAVICTAGNAVASWEGTGRESHFQAYMDHIFLDNVPGNIWEYSFSAAPGVHAFCVTAWTWSGGSPPACATFSCEEQVVQISLVDRLCKNKAVSFVSPNPFNPTTQIEFELGEAQHVSLVIYDIRGREVETLVNGDMESGIHTRMWDASRLASGVYFAKLETGSNVRVEKLLLMK